MAGPIDDLGSATLQAWGLRGIGEVRAGDDVAQHVIDGVAATDARPGRRRRRRGVEQDRF